MLASITPLGERGRGFSWRLTATAFATGAIGAGALAGAVLGAVGGLIPLGPTARTTAVLLTLAVTLAFDTVLRRHLPTSRRQVNEDWLGRYRGWVYGVGFGAQLGFGGATVVTSAAIYGTAALAMIAGSAPAGALIGGAFGLLRAASLLPARGVHDPRTLVRLHRRLGALERPVANAVAAVELGLLAAAITATAL